MKYRFALFNISPQVLTGPCVELGAALRWGGRLSAFLLLNLLDGKVDFVIADQRTATMQLHELLNDKINQAEVMGIALPVVKRHIAAARAWPTTPAKLRLLKAAFVETNA